MKLDYAVVVFYKNNFNFIKTWVLIDQMSQLIRLLPVAMKCTSFFFLVRYK